MTKLLFAGLLSAGMLLGSCSSDDDSSPTGGSIEGKWTPTKTVIQVAGEDFDQPYQDNEAGCEKDYVEFASANVFNDVIYFKNASEVCTMDAATPGTWAKSGNTLTINGSEYAGTYEITRLTGSELRARTENTAGGITSVTTIYLSKVND